MKNLRNDSDGKTMPAALDPEGEPKRLNIVAPASWVQKINDWRRQQPDMPNASEAIRRLVEAGLAADKKAPKNGR